MYVVTVVDSGEVCAQRELTSRRSALIVAAGYRRAMPEATISVETADGTLLQLWDAGRYRFPGGFSRPAPSDSPHRVAG